MKIAWFIHTIHRIYANKNDSDHAASYICSKESIG
jgi:hypothetical protein